MSWRGREGESYVRDEKECSCQSYVKHDAFYLYVTKVQAYKR